METDRISIDFVWGYGGDEVYFVSSANDWGQIKMTQNEREEWVHTMSLRPGFYEYKFIVDGKWFYDVKRPYKDDNFGGKNNCIIVKTRVTIVHISDTHGFFHKSLPKGDILVHSGDFCKDGTIEEYKQFNEWLGEQSFEYTIVVLGNTDLLPNLCDSKCPIKQASKLLSNAIVLNSRTVNVLGIKMYGIEWYCYHTWDYQYIDPSCKGKEAWDKIPLGTNILITHGPPFGVLGSYFGSKELMERIQDVKPRYHLFGHIHNCYGMQEVMWQGCKITTFVNSSGASEDSTELVNPPHVIVYEQ